MVDQALSRMSLTEISEALLKREVSSQEVVRNSLEELEKRAPLTQLRGSFVSRTGTGRS